MESKLAMFVVPTKTDNSEARDCDSGTCLSHVVRSLLSFTLVQVRGNYRKYRIGQL